MTQKWRNRHKSATRPTSVHKWQGASAVPEKTNWTASTDTLSTQKWRRLHSHANTVVIILYIKYNKTAYPSNAGLLYKVVILCNYSLRFSHSLNINLCMYNCGMVIIVIVVKYKLIMYHRNFSVVITKNYISKIKF